VATADAGPDSMIVLWNVATGQPVHTIASPHLHGRGLHSPTFQLNVSAFCGLHASNFRLDVSTCRGLYGEVRLQNVSD